MWQDTRRVDTHSDEVGLMQLREFMKTGVVTIGLEDAASVAWSRMRGRRIRHLVVTDDARVVGVLSEHDLGGRGGGDIRRGRLVRDLMTPRPVSATPTTTLRQAASLMRRGPIGSLPGCAIGSHLHPPAWNRARPGRPDIHPAKARHEAGKVRDFR